MRATLLFAILNMSAVGFANSDAQPVTSDSVPTIYRCTEVDNVLNGCGEVGCGEGCGESAEANRESCCLDWLRFDSEATSILGDDNPIDGTNGPVKKLFSFKDDWTVPVNFGGWHWWNIDTAGLGNGGYGAKGFSGTYAYYLMADPKYDLGEGRSVGGFMFLAGRDDDFYRPYYSRRFWFLEGYASVSDSKLGTLKGGLVNTKFGLGNYLGFVGSTPYFAGFQQDPDYGFSWEKTSQPDNISMDSSLQFFIHDGEWNGGLTNQNTESVAQVHERNTLVARVSPKMTLEDGSTMAVGLSGLVGEIHSDLAGFFSGTRAVWGTHCDYNQGPLNLRGEVLQIFGTTVPTMFTSGGPSNEVTLYTTEAGYTVGPVKYRAMFSQSHDANPNGSQTIWSAGTVLQITPNVRTFVEYSDWTVDGNSAFGSADIIRGVQVVLHWHY